LSRKQEHRIADTIWLSHVYFRVDPDIVWDVVQNKVPELLRTLQAFKDEDQPSVANQLETDLDR